MANPPDFRSLERNIKSSALNSLSNKVRSAKSAASSVGNLPLPTPTITPTPSVTPSITPTKTPTPTGTPTVTPTITPSYTPTLTPTPSITPTVTPSPVPLVNSQAVTAGTFPVIAGDIIVTDSAQNFTLFWNGPDRSPSGVPQAVYIYVDNVFICSFQCSTGRIPLNASNGGAFAISITGPSGMKYYGNFSGSGSESGIGLGVVYRFVTGV